MDITTDPALVPVSSLFVTGPDYLQTPQAVPHFVFMGAGAAVVTTAADVVFAPPAGPAAIIAAGITSGQDGQYHGTTVVLGHGASDVVLGLNAVAYTGGGADVVTFTTGLPSELVVGQGHETILNNEAGKGVFQAGGIMSDTATNYGHRVINGAGGVTDYFAAGPVR